MRALITQKNDAQKGCAMQLNGITLKTFLQTEATTVPYIHSHPISLITLTEVEVTLGPCY